MKERIVSPRDSGKDCKVISRSLDVSSSAVRNILKKVNEHHTVWGHEAPPCSWSTSSRSLTASPLPTRTLLVTALSESRRNSHRFVVVVEVPLVDPPAGLDRDGPCGRQTRPVGHDDNTGQEKSLQHDFTSLACSVARHGVPAQCLSLCVTSKGKSPPAAALRMMGPGNPPLLRLWKPITSVF